MTGAAGGAQFAVADLASVEFEQETTPWLMMAERLRAFLDNVAAMPADDRLVAKLDETLETWNKRLAPAAVGEGERMFGRAMRAHGRGQTMAPKIVYEHVDATGAEGTVRFGNYFLGRNGAAHGGAIPLMFDEILGRLSNAGGRAVGRTAYLKTDYRAITPVDTELRVHAWLVSEEGRKRVLRAELRHGEVLCAEAEGLFIALRPGQP